MSEHQPNTTVPDPNTPLRMRLALMILRDWSMGDGYNGGVMLTVRDWIDAGMNGPIPWPGGAFFEEWAERKGLSNVDGFVGFRIKMQLQVVQ